MLSKMNLNAPSMAASFFRPAARISLRGACGRFEEGIGYNLFVMNASHSTRRQLLAGSLSMLAAGQAPSQSPNQASKKLSVVCVGAHPDNPESGCGGTLARYSEAGHKVGIVYLTRGERGIPGKSLDEAAWRSG
jgi:hypothetical protein